MIISYGEIYTRLELHHFNQKLNGPWVITYFEHHRAPGVKGRLHKENNIDLINYKVALIGIYEYLDPFYFEGYNEGNKDIGGFLGSLSPCEDCSPMDQALVEDWQEVLGDIKEIAVEDCFHKMIEFLEVQSDMGWPEVGEFLKSENLSGKSKEVNLKQLSRWHEAIERASQYKVCGMTLTP